MRPVLRALAPIIAAVGIAIAASPSALAAAEPTSTSLDASFCYQAGVRQYCYEIDGTLRYLDTAAGSSIQVNKVTKTTAFEDGVEVGSAISASMGRSTFEADGTVVIDSVTHTHSTLGDEPCQYRLVLRLVDYEAIVLHEEATCGA